MEKATDNVQNKRFWAAIWPRAAEQIESENEKLDCYRWVRGAIPALVETLPDSLTHDGNHKKGI
ncbi:MAG: hypothetical protein U5O15_06850 [Candidatus Krumholzibacteriota bacterium]|nr:hypothetical protein [Candidatus Krumholzibacteriota bacterium]